MIRAELKAAWEEARKTMKPIEAWASIVENPEVRKSYTAARGLGGLVRTTWDEALEIIASANLYTIKKYGPDRISGFSPIPGYSMVSYGSGTRYLSLIGGALFSSDLGRADRRSGIRSLVLFKLHHRLGYQHLDDPYPGRSLLNGSPL